MILDFPPANSESDRLHVVLGRSLALAVRFEANCYSLAQMAGIAIEIGIHGKALLEDPSFVQKVFDRIHGQRLAHRIQEIAKFTGIGDFKNTLDEGRTARNELIHDLLVAHDAFLHQATWQDLVCQKLAVLIPKIAAADSLASLLFSELMGQPVLDEEAIAAYPEKALAWVFGGSAPLTPASTGRPASPPAR